LLASPGGCRLHFEQPGASAYLGSTLAGLLRLSGVPDRPLVYLCIGTDRSTGDALGPLVGEQLRAGLRGEAEVMGTLQEPVHASNLPDVVGALRRREPAAVVVAVDACLGRLESVGTITVGAGALVPGAGVNKALPEVGAAFVTGTVNVGGFMEYFVLQNTRLHLVVRMAEVIGRGLALAARLSTASAARPATEECGDVAPALA
jgi:putative sporulation protein YyaC